MANYSGVVLSGTSLVVSGWESATDVSIYNNGRMYVSGGEANGTAIYFGGMEFLDAGGVDSGATVSGLFSSDAAGWHLASARQEVYNGGIASNAVLIHYGFQNVYYGGVARNTVVQVKGSQTIYNGGTAYGTVVSGRKEWPVESYAVWNQGLVVVQSGGLTSESVVLQYGIEVVSYGGKSFNTHVSSGGIQVAVGLAMSTIVSDGGAQYLRDGGTASDTVVSGESTYTFQYISSNSLALDTHLYGSCWQNINGGRSVRTVISGGFQSVQNGASQSAVIINGKQFVASDGVADMTTIGANASQRISAAAMAFRTIVASGGRQYVTSGGYSWNTTVQSGGSASIFSGATTADTTIEYGGVCYLYANATVEGFLEIAGSLRASGTVNVSDADIILNPIDPNGAAIVDRLGSIAGARSYTVKSTTGLAAADYVLAASGAFGFQNTVTVVDENRECGSVSVGNPLISGHDSYYLTISEKGALTLTKEHHVQPVRFFNYDGDMIYDTAVWSGGLPTHTWSVEVLSGGLTESIILYDNMFQNVSSGGRASGTILVENACQYLHRGGYAYDTRITKYQSLMCPGINQYIYAGAVASKTTLYGDNAEQRVESGGAAFETFLEYGAIQRIHAWGLAWNTTLFGAAQWVSESGMAQYTDIRSGGWQDVAGIALYTTIESGGVQNIRSGSVAADIIVSSGAKLNVAASAAVTRAVLRDGAVLGYDFNAKIDAVSAGIPITLVNSESCDFEILSGVNIVSRGFTSLRAHILAGGSMTVLNGGETSAAQVESEGSLKVNSGGRIYNTLMSGVNGLVTVGSGGTAFDIWAGCNLNRIFVESGGKAYNTSGGILFHYAGFTCPLGLTSIVVDGEAWNTVLVGGSLSVNHTGAIRSTQLQGGSASIYGSAYDTEIVDGKVSAFGIISQTVLSGGTLDIDGGTEYETRIFGNGTENILSGAESYSTEIYTGDQIVHNGGKSYAAMLSGGTQYISAGGIASGADIYSGRQWVCSAGSAMISIIHSGGAMMVCRGGAAMDFTAESGAVIGYDFGATVSGTSGGAMVITNPDECRNFIVTESQNVSAGLLAVGTIVSGLQTVQSGGRASDTAVYGRMLVSGGNADRTVVTSGGRMILTGDGTAHDITVLDGGELMMTSGTIGGVIRVASGYLQFGLFAYAEKGCRVIMDISGRESDLKTPMVNYGSIAFSETAWTIEGNTTPGYYDLIRDGNSILARDTPIELRLAGETVGFFNYRTRSLTVGEFTYKMVDNPGGTLAMSVSGKFKTYSGRVSGGNANCRLESSTVAQLVTGTPESVSGNATIRLNLVGSNTCNIYGGGNNANVGGGIVLELTGAGVYSGLIYGGSRADGGNIETGGVAIKISGITQTYNAKMLRYGSTAWIVGGGAATDAGTLSAGTITVSISDAALGYIVGGAQAQGENSLSVVEATSIEIKAGQIHGDVFGGSYAYDGAASVVTGDTSILLDASEQIFVGGTIYAGGANPYHASKGGSSIVRGNATVTFTGRGENLSIGVVSGDGMVEGTVQGTRILQFSNFTGDFIASVKNFDVISFTGETAMAYHGGDFTAQTFEFDLAGRTRVNYFAEGFVFGDGDKLLKIELGNKSGNFDLMTCENANILEDMRVELYKNGTLYADFDFGQTEKGCTVAVNNGMLALFT